MTWRPPEHDRARGGAVPVADALGGWDLGVLVADDARSSSASIIWGITTRPVAEAKANRPSLIAPATSARATVASSGRSATRAASSASATFTTATFFFTVVPFLKGFLVVPDPYQLAGLRRGTTASLQQLRDIVAELRSGAYA